VKGLRHLITERCVISHASLELLSAAWLKLIMKLGPLPDDLKPDIQCVSTQWIRGFMPFPADPAHPDCDADGAGVT